MPPATYSAQVLPATYSVTAGPLLPGYPASNSASGQVVTASNTTSVPDIPLTGVPNLIYNTVAINDTGGNGNGNGWSRSRRDRRAALRQPDQQRRGDQHRHQRGAQHHDARRDGYAKHVGVSEHRGRRIGPQQHRLRDLAGSHPGVRHGHAVQPGSDDGARIVQLPVLDPASIPQPPASAYFDNFENDINGWTTGGTGNAWAQTTALSHSPTHSWTDSPAGNYANDVNSWLQSPVINLAGKTGVGVSGFFKYALEAGFDYAYLEYSTDGGTTYNATPLATFNGVEANWVQTSVSAAALDNQANTRLRLRFLSDSGVVLDGIYVDDFNVSYQPLVCQPPNPATLPNLAAAGASVEASAAADARPERPAHCATRAPFAAGAVILRRKHMTAEQ